MIRMFKGWSVARWIRMAFAVVFLIAGISGNEPVAYAAALFFGLQAVFNLGCCGTLCQPAEQPTGDPKTPPITYEEVR